MLQQVYTVVIFVGALLFHFKQGMSCWLAGGTLTKLFVCGGVVGFMQLVAATQLRLVSTLTANIFRQFAEPEHKQELILLDREMTQE